MPKKITLKIPKIEYDLPSPSDMKSLCQKYADKWSMLCNDSDFLNLVPTDISAADNRAKHILNTSIQSDN